MDLVDADLRGDRLRRVGHVPGHDERALDAEGRQLGEGLARLGARPVAEDERSGEAAVDADVNRRLAGFQCRALQPRDVLRHETRLAHPHRTPVDDGADSGRRDFFRVADRRFDDSARGDLGAKGLCEHVTGGPLGGPDEAQEFALGD